jgi:hypothetical protein
MTERAIHELAIAQGQSRRDNLNEEHAVSTQGRVRTVSSIERQRNMARRKVCYKTAPVCVAFIPIPFSRWGGESVFCISAEVVGMVARERHAMRRDRARCNRTPRIFKHRQWPLRGQNSGKQVEIRKWTNDHLTCLATAATLRQA